jgi:hypothetical protein
MNWKFVWIAAVAAFVTLFGLEWLVHGVVLKGLYEDNPAMLRTPDEMQMRFVWMLLGYALSALMMALAYARLVGRRGLFMGALFGLLVAGIFVPGNLVLYAVAPYPLEVALAWLASGLVEYMFVGAVVGAIYRGLMEGPHVVRS